MWLYYHEILLILGAHWLADFSAQTHWQATNKSKNNLALASHVLTYMLVLGGCFSLFYDFNSVARFVMYNGLIHFFTDFVTSRLNTYLWNKKDAHTFFVSVGADQILHYVVLFYSFTVFFR